jgi:hypothetical protein
LNEWIKKSQPEHPQMVDQFGAVKKLQLQKTEGAYAPVERYFSSRTGQHGLGSTLPKRQDLFLVWLFKTAIFGRL